MVPAMRPGVCLLTAILAVWMGPVVGDIELIPARPWLNGSVTFIVTGVQERILFSNWYRGSDTNADDQIFRLQYNLKDPLCAIRFFEEAIGFSNGSFQIVNLRKDFEGPYTVWIQTDTVPKQFTVQLTILAILAIWMDLAVGDIELIPARPWLNSSVTFIVTGVQGEILFSDWYRGSGTNADDQIFRLQSNRIIKGKRFFEEAIGFSNGSFQIVNLRKDFEGPYTVSIQTDTVPKQFTAHLTILDKEPPPPPPPPGPLSDGEIAGICIAVLVVVSAAIGGGVYAHKKKAASPPNAATYDAVNKETPMA